MLEALRRHEGRFLGRHVPVPRRMQVFRRLLACRTAKLGAHLIACDDCGIKLPVYNSCLDRHCPQCQGPATAAWLADRKAKMLPVPHFQVVFTLPGELRPIAMANQELVYSLLMRASAGVLQDLASQRMDAQLGILSVLHTWNDQLGYHPHVHHLVTAGGLGRKDERWVPSRPDWLFPQRIMGAMFRGRVLEALILAQARGELHLGGDELRAAKDFRSTVSALSKRHARWVVHEEAPQGRPVEHVVKYLARYVKRVAIADGRVRVINDRQVVIATRRGLVGLDGAEFVRRFLLHVLPSGFRKVRHFGLYAPGNAKHRLEVARRLVRDVTTPSPRGPNIANKEHSDKDASTTWTCPSCGSAKVVTIFVLAGRQHRRARAPP